MTEDERKAYQRGYHAGRHYADRQARASYELREQRLRLARDLADVAERLLAFGGDGEELRGALARFYGMTDAELEPVLAARRRRAASVGRS